MKKILLGLILTCFIANVSAKEVDLSLYIDRCVTLYKTDVKRNGVSELNGVYLKYKGDEDINTVFESFYFSPDFNLSVDDNKKTHNMIDVEKKGNSFTFYDQNAKKNGDRNGYRWIVKRIDEENYELSISYSTRSVRNKDRSFRAIYDEPLEFGSDITTLKLVRDFESEKALYTENSQFTLNCRKKV